MIPSVTTDELLQALAIVDAPPPLDRPISFGDFVIADTPFTRGTIALAKAFGREKAYALQMRLSVLADFIEAPELAEFVEWVDGKVSFAEPLALAIATIPIDNEITSGDIAAFIRRG